MSFGGQVRCFSCDGINMVGNLDNGIVVGLDVVHASLCREFLLEKIDEEEMARKAPELFAALEKGGFFVEKSERKELNTAYLHVTNHCNLQCVGCYSRIESRNNSRNLSLNQICRIIDDLGLLGVKNLIISGGEPFLRTDLPSIVEYGRRVIPNARIVVLTNGIGLTKSQINAVAKSVDCISVSIDGHSEHCEPTLRGRSVYKEVLHTISLIKDTSVEPHLIATIHGKNVHDVQRYVDLAQSLGATLNFSLLSCLGEVGVRSGLRLTDKALEELADEVLFKSGMAVDDVNPGISAQTICGIGRRTISVAADGMVYPCHMLHRGGYAIGDASKHSLLDMMERYDLGQSRLFEVDQLEECSRCEYRYLCGGGCRARAVCDGAGPEHRDPYCALMKHYYHGLFVALLRTLDK